jgi:hypothetical protein
MEMAMSMMRPAVVSRSPPLADISLIKSLS